MLASAVNEEDGKIHIFSLATGHLYERLLRIMMLSVSETKCAPLSVVTIPFPLSLCLDPLSVHSHLSLPGDEAHVSPGEVLALRELPLALLQDHRRCHGTGIPLRGRRTTTDSPHASSP